MTRYRTASEDSDNFDDFEDIGISVMEELDPEPQPKPGSVYAREFIVGVLLVLAVLVFAGWQWWQTEVRQSNYKLGDRAAQQFDWDEAHDRFKVAEGYRDADKRAQAAYRRIQERDRYYRLAVDHFNNERWAAALQQLRIVKEVQPNYRDLAWMMERAEEQVYSSALRGAVVLRAKADPPGLYYRGQTDWVWLEGSDEHSLTWGQGTKGRVLYDAPIEGWVPAGGSNRPTNRRDPDPSQRNFDGRRLMMAVLETGGGDATLASSELPFELDDFSWFEWHHEGIWNIRYTNGGVTRAQGPIPVRQKIDYIEQLTYHAFGTKIMRSTNPTFFGMNVALMNFNQNGDSLLVANWTRHPDGTFTTALYLNSLTNGENRLLYNYDGGFISAEFSSDGRYVFLATYKPVTSTMEDRTLLMIDTTGVKPQRVLLDQRGVIIGSVTGVDGEDSIYAQLLEGGPMSGKVFLTHWISGTNYITALDPEGEGPVPPMVSIPGTSRIWWTAAASEGRDTVFWGIGSMNLEESRLPPRKALLVVTIAPGRPPVVAQMNIESMHNVEFVQQQGSDLYFLFYDYGPPGKSRVVELSSVSLLEAGQGRLERKPLRSYNTRVKGSNTSFFELDFKFNFGPGMFAYLDDTNLRATTYDGEIDLPLDSDVAELFSLTAVAP